MLLGDSKGEYWFIRSSIFLLQYLGLICLLYFFLALAINGLEGISNPFSIVVEVLGTIEILFFVFWYIPTRNYIQRPGNFPPPMTRQERRALFHKTLNHVPDLEGYAKKWIGFDEVDDIGKVEMQEWLLWALFERQGDPDEDEDELEEYIAVLEKKTGRAIKAGRGRGKPLRLAFDPVHMSYRTPWLYLGIGAADAITHVWLMAHGFDFYRLDHSRLLSTFPFRLLSLVAPNQSPSNLSYHYRPATSPKHKTLVFLHGIGIGLWPYSAFFEQIPDDVGILALEFLPVSSRVTERLPPMTEVAASISTIAEHHSIDNIVLIAHSFGTLVTPALLANPSFRSRISSLILLDPVSILLHLPDVAYNFTRREPRTPAEWEIYFFASRDPGIAWTLGRHFCWRECTLWVEDFSGIKTSVIIGEKDCLSNSNAISSYIHTGGQSVSKTTYKDKEAWAQTPYEWSGKKELELVWMKGFNHGQISMCPEGLKVVKKVVDGYCLETDKEIS